MSTQRTERTWCHREGLLRLQSVLCSGGRGPAVHCCVAASARLELRARSPPGPLPWHGFSRPILVRGIGSLFLFAAQRSPVGWVTPV